MEVTKHRIITLGDYPDSKGGLYNPGVVAEGDERLLLVRHEKDYYFTNDVSATLVRGNIKDLKKGKNGNFSVLKREGFPSNCRIEDFRLFKYKGELYASHTLVETKKGVKEAYIIKPVVSKIIGDTIKYWDFMDLPIKMNRFEKNWLLWEWNGELYCIYSIDPLVIFKLEGWSWKLLKNEENGIAHFIREQLPNAGYISVSAITPLDETRMLAFWHTIHDGIYKQGIFVLDMSTLDVTCLTEPVLQGGGLKGYKPEALYVSGLVVAGDKLEVWCGEADANTCMIEIGMKDVHDLIAKYPYKKITPKKILFRDNGLGDFICAAHALTGLRAADPLSKLKLYCTRHMELFSTMRLKGIEYHLWNGEKVDVDLTSTMDKEEEQERLRTSFKKFYSDKLGVLPVVPNMEHIKPNDKYEDYIVVAPYAAWDNRTWNIKYWTLLTEILSKMGHKILVIDMHTGRCSHLKGEMHCERSIMDDFRAIKAAKCVISNESGVAHIGGLLGTPTLVLCGYLTKDGHPNPEQIYDMTNNQFIFKRKLQEITVDEVIEKLREMKEI